MAEWTKNPEIYGIERRELNADDADHFPGLISFRRPIQECGFKINKLNMVPGEKPW